MTPTTDLTGHHIEGIAHHGNTPFSVPLVSHIAGTLYVGGCIDGVPLPEDIKHVVSLYQWERYRPHDGVVSQLTVRMFDAAEMPREQLLWAVASHVNRVCALGNTLVHCQAGLNRSGLIAALALVLSGHDPAAAVSLLRQRRCSASLCNPVFEEFVLSQPAGGRS